MTNEKNNQQESASERESMLLECLAEAMGTNKKALKGDFAEDVRTIFFQGLYSVSSDLLVASRSLEMSGDPEITLVGSTIRAIQGRLDLSRELYEMVTHQRDTARFGSAV